MRGGSSSLEMHAAMPASLTQKTRGSEEQSLIKAEMSQERTRPRSDCRPQKVI